MCELDVLICIQSLCNSDLKCNASNISQVLGISAVDLLPYLEEMKQKAYISVYLGGEIQLHQKGVDAIERAISEKESEKKKKIYKHLANVLKWIFGIIATVIGALIIWYLGLD